MMKSIIVATAMIVSIGLTGVNAGIVGDSTVMAGTHYEAARQDTLADISQKIVGNAQTDTIEKTITDKEIQVLGSREIIEVITGVDADEAMEIMVVSLTGETVYEGVISGYTSTISLEGKVQPGTYMVQLNSGDIQKTKRIEIR